MFDFIRTSILLYLFLVWYVLAFGLGYLLKDCVEVLRRRLNAIVTAELNDLLVRLRKSREPSAPRLHGAHLQQGLRGLGRHPW